MLPSLLGSTLAHHPFLQILSSSSMYSICCYNCLKLSSSGSSFFLLTSIIPLCTQNSPLPFIISFLSYNWRFNFWLAPFWPSFVPDWAFYMDGIIWLFLVYSGGPWRYLSMMKWTLIFIFFSFHVAEGTGKNLHSRWACIQVKLCAIIMPSKNQLKSLFLKWEYY